MDLGSKNGVFVGSARVRSAWLSARASGFVIGRTAVVVTNCAKRSGESADPSVPWLIGASEPMRRVRAEIHRVARLRAPVLITGESGAGKDLVARALHHLSGRTGRYVPLNMGAIADSLADSELFGHRRGAFTGAMAARVGAFQHADGGTLFMDEIVELSPSIQVKLLRVLEDGCIRPVGTSESHRVDVRVLSATWKSLHKASEDGRFRFDLLQRLSTVRIEVPPLRRRASDLPALAEHLLSRQEPEIGKRVISSGAMARLVSYGWPGNVRELASVLYRAGASSDGPVIDLCHVEGALAQSVEPKANGDESADVLLARAEGNVSRAARMAGMPRTTFRTWLARSRSQTTKTASTS